MIRFNREATVPKGSSMAGGMAFCLAASFGAGYSPVAGAEAVTLEEIIVTARKREENLQKTPVSITAFTTESLEARQLNNIAEIGKFTPGVSFESGANISGSSSSMTMFIRGIGQTDFNLTIDPGVALYVDGVYVSRSVGALFDTLDLESIQVLRGPQGTLFGKNTIGGAVVVTSKQPGEDFEVNANVTTGRYDRLDSRGVINAPVSDKVKLRASGAIQTRDGYVERLSDGAQMGNKDSRSARVSLLLEPTDDLAITLTADGTRVREQGLPVILLAVNENGAFAGFHNGVVVGPPCVPTELAPGVPNTARLSDPRCYNAQWITGSEYATWTDSPNSSDLDLWGAGITVDWDVDGVAVKSISAYRHLESTFDFDGDGSPLTVGHSANDYSQEQFSQEVQFSGRAAEDRLRWLFGLYYLKEKGTDLNHLTFSIADFLSGGMVENDSYAAFAQATYDITDALSLTFGGRHTYERKRFLPDQFIINDRTGGGLLALSQSVIPPHLNPDGNRILPFVEVSTTVDEFTPSLTLDYEFTPEILGYLSASKGFKSGGFTQRVFPPETETPAFDPEFVTNYEVGIKTELFADHLRLNAAGFYSDYTDLQILVLEGIAPKVRNAGEARITGFEAEAVAAINPRLQLSGGVGYVDAAYLEVRPSAAPVTVDSELANAPEWTATAGVSMDVLQTDLGVLNLRGDWSYKGGHFKDAVNSPDLYQDGVHLVSVSATFRTGNGRWAVTGGVTNLTDEAWLISGFQDLASVSSVSGAFSRPREWYLRLAFRNQIR